MRGAVSACEAGAAVAAAETASRSMRNACLDCMPPRTTMRVQTDHLLRRRARSHLACDIIAVPVDVGGQDAPLRHVLPHRMTAAVCTARSSLVLLGRVGMASEHERLSAQIS